jgi:hypothetical protein
VGVWEWRKSVRSARSDTDLRQELVGIDHIPAELQIGIAIATLPPLQSPPVHSGKRGLRYSTLAFTTVQDDPDIMPVLKFPSQLFVPIQAGAGDYKHQDVQVTSVTSLELL